MLTLATFAAFAAIELITLVKFGNDVTFTFANALFNAPRFTVDIFAIALFNCPKFT